MSTVRLSVVYRTETNVAKFLGHGNSKEEMDDSRGTKSVD